MPRTADPKNQLKATPITQAIAEELEKDLVEIPKKARKVLRDGFTMTEGEGDDAVDRPSTPAENVEACRKLYGRGYTKIQRMLKENAMAENAS